jgi:hypothetical protein
VNAYAFVFEQALLWPVVENFCQRAPNVGQRQKYHCRASLGATKGNRGADLITGSPCRSADTQSFKRAMDAHNHPDFYRQLGKNPEQITAEALESLARRFGLQN